MFIAAYGIGGWLISGPAAVTARRPRAAFLESLPEELQTQIERKRRLDDGGQMQCSQLKTDLGFSSRI
jgi:hypothetical protein